MGISTPGESVSLERKIESSIFLCIPRDLNILGKSCTTFVIVKIVRNLSRGRSPCQRVNHVKSGVIYFSAFIFSYDTIYVSGTIHTWNRGLTIRRWFHNLVCNCRVPHKNWKEQLQLDQYQLVELDEAYVCSFYSHSCVLLLS